MRAMTSFTGWSRPVGSNPSVCKCFRKAVRAASCDGLGRGCSDRMIAPSADTRRALNDPLAGSNSASSRVSSWPCFVAVASSIAAASVIRADLALPAISATTSQSDLARGEASSTCPPRPLASKYWALPALRRRAIMSGQPFASRVAASPDGAPDPPQRAACARSFLAR